MWHHASPHHDYYCIPPLSPHSAFPFSKAFSHLDPQPLQGMNGAASELIPSPCECTSQPPLVQKYRSLSAVEPCSPPAGDWDAPEEEEEEGGRFLGVSMRKPGALRGSTHMYDSFRRHSWEPGKVLGDDPDFDQRRYIKVV